MPQTPYANRIVPKKVLRRQRWRLLKTIGFTAILLAILVSSVWTNRSQTRQLKQTQDRLEVLQQELVKINDPIGSGAVNQPTIEEQLFAFLGATGQAAEQTRISEELTTGYSALSQVDWPEQLDYQNGALLSQNDPLVTFTFDELQPAILVTTPTDDYVFTDPDAFSDFVNTINTNQVSKWQAELESMLSMEVALLRALDSAKVAKLLTEKNLTYRGNEYDSLVDLLGADDNSVGYLNWGIEPGGNPYYETSRGKRFSPGNLDSQLQSYISTLDSRTQLEILFADQQQELEAIFTSKAFQAALVEQQVQLLETREEADGMYYTFTSQLTGETQTLVLLKGTGQLQVVEGNSLVDLQTFTSTDKKKTLEIPDNLGLLPSAPSSSNTFLLAGKHGSLTDTLMLAIVNDQSRSISLVSLPRDLWWNQRKINSYYAYGGMPYLVEQIEEIAQIDIEHYALVDMYAFVEVVNILGGVDVTLAEAVIDPTYRTLDDGVWGTLHYEPGTYHLNGTEALRLARSRHYSSDFARSERQQLILQSLQTKAQEFSLANLVRLTAVAEAVLDYLDTDVNTAEALALFKRYKNYEIRSAGVLTSRNVLQAKYSNQEAYDECIAEDGDDCSQGAYILIPENDDWDVIPWYIQQLAVQAS